MATLAESFLQDLEDLSDDGDDHEASESEQGEGEQGDEDDQVRGLPAVNMHMGECMYACIEQVI